MYRGPAVLTGENTKWSTLNGRERKVEHEQLAGESSEPSREQSNERSEQRDESNQRAAAGIRERSSEHSSEHSTTCICQRFRSFFRHAPWHSESEGHACDAWEMQACIEFEIAHWLFDLNFTTLTDTPSDVQKVKSNILKTACARSRCSARHGFVLLDM